jgi:hypothetical protein
MSESSGEFSSDASFFLLRRSGKRLRDLERRKALSPTLSQREREQDLGRA